MTQFLVAIHRPHGYDAAQEDAAMCEEISALNREMAAAGVRVFVGGLRPLDEARAVRPAGGTATVTDGPYLETKEFVGGFWVLECAGMDEALAWGRKAAVACRTGVEVRAFH